MKAKIELYNQGKLTKEKFLEIFQGWQAYAKWANVHKLKKELTSSIKLLNIKDKIFEASKI